MDARRFDLLILTVAGARRYDPSPAHHSDGEIRGSARRARRNGHTERRPVCRARARRQASPWPAPGSRRGTLIQGFVIVLKRLVSVRSRLRRRQRSPILADLLRRASARRALRAVPGRAGVDAESAEEVPVTRLTDHAVVPRFPHAGPLHAVAVRLAGEADILDAAEAVAAAGHKAEQSPPPASPQLSAPAVSHALNSIEQMPWPGAWRQNFLRVPCLRTQRPEAH